MLHVKAVQLQENVSLTAMFKNNQTPPPPPPQANVPPHCLLYWRTPHTKPHCTTRINQLQIQISGIRLLCHLVFVSNFPHGDSTVRVAFQPTTFPNEVKALPLAIITNSTSRQATTITSTLHSVLFILIVGLTLLVTPDCSCKAAIQCNKVVLWFNLGSICFLNFRSKNPFGLISWLLAPFSQAQKVC